MTGAPGDFRRQWAYSSARCAPVDPTRSDGDFGDWLRAPAAVRDGYVIRHAARTLIRWT